MSLNSTKDQQKNLLYLKLLYLINYWWTIEQKSLGGTKQLNKIIYQKIKSSNGQQWV
jgi:hypothetical protein